MSSVVFCKCEACKDTFGQCEARKESSFPRLDNFLFVLLTSEDLSSSAKEDSFSGKEDSEKGA